MKTTRSFLLGAGLALVLAAPAPAATTFTPFGPQGQGGSKNGQTFTIGSGGSVFELDAFLRLDGYDLNGALAGTSAQLSAATLPAGLAFTFTAGVSNDTDAVLTYLFANTSSGTFTNLRFAVLLDAEIDQELNTFFNEYGAAVGTLGAGPGDIAPDQWQIDEPGFAGGTLYQNLYLGTLNNSNAIPAGVTNDVALGLGFFLGDLPAGRSASVSVMISGAGHSLGTFALQQFDAASAGPQPLGLNPSPGPAPITLSAIVSTLTGTIFQDRNRNGLYDPGEGLAGVTVQLLGGEAVVAAAVTDAQGNYSFSSPPAGNYTVRVNPATLPVNLVNTVDPDGTPDNQTQTTLTPGQLQILNWGYQEVLPAQLTGTIFRDLNTNGVGDAGEGLTNVTVQVRSNAVLVAQTATGPGGGYSFTNLPAGSYTVQVVAATLPAGLTNSVDPDGVRDGQTVITLLPGDAQSLNWGYQAPPGTETYGDATALVDFGLTWRLKQSTGTLLGTLSLTNHPGSGKTLAAPFRLGFPTSTNFWLAHPSGNLDNGLPYLNLTTGVVAQAGTDGVLSPGEWVVLVDGVEIYSRNRSAPPNNLFQLWTTQQP